MLVQFSKEIRLLWDYKSQRFWEKATPKDGTHPFGCKAGAV